MAVLFAKTPKGYEEIEKPRDHTRRAGQPSILTFAHRHADRQDRRR